MTHKQQKVSALSPIQLYDIVMARIEPELTSEGMKTLDERAKNETKEQKITRLERYQKAFDTFDAVIADVSKMALDDAIAQRQETHAKVQKQEQKEHADDLRHVEELLNPSDSAL